MKIFAGLGNPGAAYALNRHNIGFMAVDSIAAAHGFGPWKSRFLGLACEGRIGAHKLTLLKPATFMNDSGRSVGEAVRFFKVDIDNVELSSVVMENNITAVPTFVAYAGLERVGAMSGADRAALRRMVKELIEVKELGAGV